MKVYIVNAGYSGGRYFDRALREVFSTREKAEERIKWLIETEKARIRHADYEFKESVDAGQRECLVRFWLKWGPFSNCWEIHELEVE